MLRAASCRPAVACVALTLAGIATAQQLSPTTVSEHANLIKSGEVITAYGADLFGDKINLYNGGLEFVQVDVSIPGNNALPVMVGRRLVTGQSNLGNAQFREWALEIPHLHGVFSSQYGWRGTGGSLSRCSAFGAPPDVTNGQTTYKWFEYWYGNSIYVPGLGDQEILKRSPGYANAPADGNTWPLVTKNDWQLRCLASLGSTNAATPANETGEGFLAIAPDGTQYRFDWLVTREHTTLSKPAEAQASSLTGAGPTLRTQQRSGALPRGVDPATGPVERSASGGIFNRPATGTVAHYSIPRVEVWILPTLVIDRFGNTVQYNYDPVDKRKLLSIQSSDGRSLRLTYVPGTAFIEGVSDGTRTWTYSYGPGASGNTMLTSVTLPDNSRWQFNGLDAVDTTGMYGRAGLIDMQLGYRSNADSPPPYCDLQPPDLDGNIAVGTMIHPSGAFGTFTMKPAAHGRNGVPLGCFNNGTSYGSPYYPAFIDSYSITQKTIAGPGLPVMNWTFDYTGTDVGGWDTWGPASIVPATVLVTNPKNEVTRYTFGATYGVDEGMLKRVDIGWDGSTALRTTETHYSRAFTQPLGTSDQNRGDNWVTSHRMPEDQRVIAQQGVTFNWQVPADSDFDGFGRPNRVMKYSSRGYSRTELLAYTDILSKWVLGQVRTVTDQATGKVMVRNEYNATTGTLEKVSRFGHPDQSMTYYADGTLRTRADGLNQTTTYESYKRGIPQKTTYHDKTTEWASVNDIGRVAWLTDQNGYTTNYGYDAIGRLASIAYPAADSVVWNGKSIQFMQMPTSEYGLEAGHWKQTITIGNARTNTYYDALWRPIYVETMDLTDATNTARIVRRDYLYDGNVIFESYPQRTVSAIVDGVHKQYDALGRETVTGTDGGPNGRMWSSYNYFGDFSTAGYDKDGYATTTHYQVFDQPTTEAPDALQMEEGVSVSIARDNFGKAKSITRSGNGKSATRSYVYDTNERLCKTIEPEIGATIQDYDLANNVRWKAIGLSLLSTGSCDTASVPVVKKITFGYDGLNRLKTTTYGDGSPSVSREYWPDGYVRTVNSNGANWTYNYNKRRLLESEKLVYGSTTYELARNYDANGGLSQLTYPIDNLKISLNPNALGEARQVGAFASSVQYHPNGTVKSFTYGNGIVHTMSQNGRLLPEWSEDSGVLRDKYEYSDEGDVLSIADWREGISNRGLGYDRLHRLKGVNGPGVWGDAFYTYDALDNILTARLTAGGTAREMTYNYDPGTNRLTSLSGTTGYAFTYFYDEQGNVKQRGSQGYVFDQGNRMQSATGKATYTYDGWSRRVSVVGADQQTRVQFYDSEGNLRFAGPSGSGTKYIYLDRHVIAEVGPTGVQYQHTDALGSPIARTDAAGALVSRTRYEPYGLTALGSVPSVGFAGHVNDADTGLVQMQQRYYDPVAARFLSIDPVTTDANTGGSFNRYAYASNSPYKYIDPDGRQERAAEAFSDQFRSDAASGNSGVYEPFHTPVAIATIGMAAGPPIAAAIIAGAPAETAVAAGAAGKATTIVAKNGVEIKSIARHAVDRAIGDGGKRAGVGPKGILDSLKNPLKITETKTDELGRASQRFIGKDATTAVNPEAGKIVSVNPTSTKTAEKLIKAAEQ